jgi:hypothetical protein
MKVTRMKEESIEVTEFPKYFKRPYFTQHCKLTENGILMVSESLIYFNEKNESKMFAESVFELFSEFYVEATEKEFNEQYHTTINRFKELL